MDRRVLAIGLTLLLAAANLLAQAPQAPTNQTGTLKIGDMAPDFTLPDNTGKTVKLSDFRGKQNVVLAFFVLAFTGG
jgi:cytochrome oxidase Cu insertion factor (SCO1/SenC/PrrC family)